MKDEDEKRELIIRAIPRKDRDAFCACFKDVREATPYEFAILREFAISQGYDFNEDADCNKYYYIFIVMDTPFG